MSSVLKKTVVKPHPFIIVKPTVQAISAGTMSAALLAQVEERQSERDAAVRAAEEEAARIVARAREQAQALLTAARQEQDKIRQQAQQDGYEAGLAMGRQEGLAQAEAQCREKLSQAAAHASSLLAAAEQERRELLNLAERQIIQVALAVAGKVLQRELTENEQAVVPIVQAALAPVVDQAVITVRVHPDDFVAVETARPELVKMLKHPDALRLAVDESLSRGDCVVDTAAGSVDARVDTQLTAIRQALEALTP